MPRKKKNPVESKKPTIIGAQGSHYGSCKAKHPECPCLSCQLDDSGMAPDGKPCCCRHVLACGMSCPDQKREVRVWK